MPDATTDIETGSHKTKIFISWSGDNSEQVAKVWDDWLRDMFHFVDTYMSSRSLEKGKGWLDDIMTNLGSVSHCIACLTPDNLESPWLNFEVGAVARDLLSNARTRIWTFALGMEKEAITSPLNVFQGTAYTKADIKALVTSINAACGTAALPIDRLNTHFERMWPELEKKLDPLEEIIKAGPQAVVTPKEITTQDIYDRLEQVVSGLQNQYALIKSIQDRPASRIAGDAIMELSGEDARNWRATVLKDAEDAAKRWIEKYSMEDYSNISTRSLTAMLNTGTVIHSNLSLHSPVGNRGRKLLFFLPGAIRAIQEELERREDPE